MNNVSMDQIFAADFDKLHKIGVHMGASCDFVTLKLKDGAKIWISINRKRHPYRLGITTNAARLKKVWTK
jgi:hypothetical protein